MNIKKISLILLLLGIFLSVSSAYAANYDDLGSNNGKNVYDAEIKDGRTIVVNVNEVINFALSTRYTDSVEWDWGDGSAVQTTKTKTQKADSVSISHKFTKTGTYIVQINQIVEYHGAIEDMGWGEGSSITVSNGDVFAIVKVVKKADLSYTQVTRNVDKKGNVQAITLGIKNKGALNAPSSYVLAKYTDPTVDKYAAIFKSKSKRNKYLKKYKYNLKKYKAEYIKLKNYYSLKKKLDKYTKKVKIKGLKSGQSTTINIMFKIPKKYQKYQKTITLNYGNKFSESIKTNNVLSGKF